MRFYLFDLLYIVQAFCLGLINVLVAVTHEFPNLCVVFFSCCIIKVSSNSKLFYFQLQSHKSRDKLATILRPVVAIPKQVGKGFLDVCDRYLIQSSCM